MAKTSGSTAKAQPNPYYPPFPGELEMYGGQELFVRHAAPTGPDPQAAVFIHGLGGNSTNWTDLMAQLTDLIDGYAVDLPGFGRSPEAVAGKYTPQDHAREVAALIREKFHGQPVHLFGNSLGGATAVQLAAAYPELVRTLTLISPALPERLPRMSSIHMPLVAIPKVGERLTKSMMAKRSAQWRVNSTLGICYAQPSRVNPQRFDEMIADAQARESMLHSSPVMLASLRGLLSTYFDYSATQPWKLAAKITVPVLLVYGRDDQLVNSRAALKAHRAFVNSRVVVIPDSGHVSQMEHPTITADAWRQLAYAPALPRQSATP